MCRINKFIHIQIDTGVAVIAAEFGEQNMGILAVFNNAVHHIPVIAVIEYGSCIPVTVEAQVGQAQIHGSLVQSAQESEAFHINTVGEVILQEHSGIVCQGDADVDSCGFTGSNTQGLVSQISSGLVADQCIQVCLNVVGVHRDVAVSVVTEFFGNEGFSLVADSSLIDQVCVVGIGKGVVIHVVGQHHTGGSCGGFTGQDKGRTCHEVVTAFVGFDIFGLDNGIHIVECLGFAEVMDIEAVSIGAGSAVVIAKFNLGHIHAVHRQVGLGGHSVEGVCKTGTLLAGRIEAVVVVGQGSCGAGQQMLRQSTDILNLGHGLFDVLHHQGSQTGNVGSSHGGTAHQTVATVNSGVDVAAGGGDIGFKTQVGCNTPGGEVAHLVSSGTGERSYFRGEGNGHSRISFLCGVQIGKVCQHDGNAGDGGNTVTQVHAEFAVGVVINDTGDCAGVGGIVDLFKEAKITAGNQSDLTGQIKTFEIFGSAIVGHKYEVIFTG